MIEPWRPEHAKGAIEVVRAVFDEYGFTWEEEGYHADLYDVPGQYLDCGDLFYVAVDEGRVVGTVAIEFFDPIPGEDSTEFDGKVRLGSSDCALLRLYVLPEARGKGIGRALLETVRDAGAAQGRKRMEIWSDKRFVDAHRLYQKLGAKIVGDRVCDDPDESPEWGLVLEI